MDFREVEITVDTEELQNYFFENLIRRGFSPTEEELEAIADVAFKFLVDKMVITED